MTAQLLDMRSLAIAQLNALPANSRKREPWVRVAQFWTHKRLEAELEANVHRQLVDALEASLNG